MAIDFISREAKDRVQKMIAEVFQSSLTEWYGLGDLRIIATRPSDVPIVTVQEQLLDRVFELDDHTLMHCEFQSTREPHLFRFFGYSAALALHYRQPVRAVVIYLCSVRDAPQRLALGSITYEVTNILIADKDGPAAWDRLTQLSPDAWSDLDVLDLAFFPFMADPRPQAERALAAAQLANTVPGEAGRLASAMIIGLTASLVEPAVLESMKEVIQMNDLITELQREAVERGWERGLAEGEVKGRAEGHLEVLLEIATARFGVLPPTVTARLRNLTDSQLLIVARGLLSMESVEALTQLLNDLH